MAEPRPKDFTIRHKTPDTDSLRQGAGNRTARMHGLFNPLANIVHVTGEQVDRIVEQHQSGK